MWPAGLYMLDRAAELEFPGIGGQYSNPEEGLMDVHEDNGRTVRSTYEFIKAIATSIACRPCVVCSASPQAATTRGSRSRCQTAPKRMPDCCA